MKKIYVSILGLAAVGSSALGQSKADFEHYNAGIKNRVAQRIDVEQAVSEYNRGGSALWSDDFSTPSNWVIAHDVTASSLDWEIGVVGCGGFAQIDTIQSTTQSNGYAMIDSDEYGGETGGTEVEDSWLTTANPIDLSGVSNVVLEFETWYRRWNYERPYVVISTDGVTWPDLTPDTDISQMPNVFDVFPDFPDATSLDQNPTLVRLNISAAAGNQSQVWIRFHWAGTWGYAWFVDDVRVVEQPANDLVTQSAYITHNGTGEEYGQIPQSQLTSNFAVGGSFYNFGYADQNNVVATLDVLDSGSNSVMSATSSYTVAESDSTYDMDEVATTSGMLPVGLYEGSLTVVSDEEMSGAGTFANNVYLRNFAVTEDRYAIDGIGVHPSNYLNLGSLGTNSFTDAADGFMMLTYYDVSQTVAVMGVEILLSTATVPGGSIIVSLHDTADVFADDVTLPLEQTDVIDVTQADVDAGMITVMFEEPFTADPNAYFASVEMFSNSNASDIRILNDLTVDQPNYSSMIYIPNDQVYTNGNAAAIRLITADNVGISETAVLEGVSVYPNPTEGLIQINVTDLDVYTVEVMNVLGERVYASTANGNSVVDLNSHTTGVYIVRVSTENASYTERVLVK